MKVYLVTSGDYSDYHVDQVFLDEEKAKHWVAAQVDNAGDRYCDEYCIDEVETADESVDCALKINYLYKIKVLYLLTILLRLNTVFLTLFPIVNILISHLAFLLSHTTILVVNIFSLQSFEISRLKKTILVCFYIKRP